MSAPELAAVPPPRWGRREILRPNLGLYLDRSPILVPERALTSCHNVRIKEGSVRVENMGWEPFITSEEAVSAEALGDQTGVVSVAFQLANAPIKPGSLFISDALLYNSTGTDTRITDYDGLLGTVFAGVGGTGVSGTIDYSTGLVTLSLLVALFGATTADYTYFSARQLNGPILLIDQFFLRSGAQALIFGTPTDLYRYDDGTDDVVFITPRFDTTSSSGVQVSITDATTTLSFSGSGFTVDDIRPGDYIVIGSDEETDPDADWLLIDSVDAGANTAELAATWNGGTQTNVDFTVRKIFTADNDELWSSETFPDAQPDNKDLWFATNGTEMVEWDGSANMVTALQGNGELGAAGANVLGFTCKVLSRYKNMMLYADLTESGERKPQTIRNSAITAPKNVTTLEASEFLVGDGVDTILEIIPLGDSVVSYSSRNVEVVQFVGLPLNFVTRTAITGLGPLAKRGVIDFGDYHEFLGPDVGYRFDGVSISEHGGQVFREVLRQVDPNRLVRTLAHIDEENGEVIWAVPLTTDAGIGPEIGYTEHYLEDVRQSEPTPFAKRDFPATATGFYEQAETLRFNDLVLQWPEYNFKWNDRAFAAAFPLNLFGTADGEIHKLGTVGNQNGLAIEAWARFSRKPAGDGRRKGIIKRIEPYCRQLPLATYDLGVILWTADQGSGDLVHAGQYLYDLAQAPTSRRFVVPRKAGRFVEVEFATTGRGRDWILDGFAIEAVQGGER